MKKRFITLLRVSCCLFFFLTLIDLNAESSPWIIGATEFLIQTDADIDVSAEKTDSISTIAKILPSLILSDLELPTVRVVTQSEIFARQSRQLEDEREVLQEDYEDKIAIRDKLVILSSEDSDYKDQLKISEQDIEQSKTALVENEKKQKELLETEIDSTSETVELYKNDSSKLYVLSDEKDPYDDVNALITGSLKSFDTYVQLKLQLILYPEQTEIYSTTVTFLPTEVSIVGENLAKELLAIIQNKKLVKLEFKILPQEIEQKTKIRIDGENVELDENRSLMVSRNSHQLSFFSEGYEIAETQSDFTEKDIYTVTVTLKKLKNYEITINSAIPLTGLFVNGKEYDPNEKFVVSMLPALGQAIVAPDVATYLILESGGIQKIEPHSQDISALIEKRRRTMYNSYGALILSLPFSFISYGMYVDANYSAYVYGSNYGSDSTYTDLVDKQDTLEVVSTIFKCVSIGLGINMIIQLIRYIKTVDEVLPEQVEPDTDS